MVIQRKLRKDQSQGISIQISVWKVGRKIHITQSLTKIFQKGRGSDSFFKWGSSEKASTMQTVSFERTSLFRTSLSPKSRLPLFLCVNTYVLIEHMGTQLCQMQQDTKRRGMLSAFLLLTKPLTQPESFHIRKKEDTLTSEDHLQKRQGRSRISSLLSLVPSPLV